MLESFCTTSPQLFPLVSASYFTPQQFWGDKRGVVNGDTYSTVAAVGEEGVTSNNGSMAAALCKA